LATTIGITRKSEGARQLQIRPDYKAEAHMFDHVLRSATPAFDKNTEDGIRFRIYEVGSLEVRTTQEVSGKELVGVVFSKRLSANEDIEDQRTKGTDKVTKVTVYVESDRCQTRRCHYYLVLETLERDMIVTEMHADGTVTWIENPTDLEDRNSLAKAFCSKDCRGMGTIIRDLTSHQSTLVNTEEARVSHTTGKRYAHGIYNRAIGKANIPCTGGYDADAQKVGHCALGPSLARPLSTGGARQAPGGGRPALQSQMEKQEQVRSEMDAMWDDLLGADD